MFKNAKYPKKGIFIRLIVYTSFKYKNKCDRMHHTFQMTYSYVLPLKLNNCTSFLMFNALFMQSARLIGMYLKFAPIKNYTELRLTNALLSKHNKLLLVSATQASCFGHVHHLQALQYVAESSQSNAYIYFKFVRSRTLYKTVQTLCSIKT